MSRLRRLTAAWLVTLVACTATGCASLFQGDDYAPSGLTRYDDGLRALMRGGEFDATLARLAADSTGGSDALLRLQNEGLAAHYAGRYEESNTALQMATELADERYTRSISQAALSFLTNDRVLPYRPPRSERLLLHYYGALNYLRMGDPEGAAVEARRLGHLLDLYERNRELSAAEQRLHATLHYVTGAVFELAREPNAASVAYRLASRGLDVQSVADAADISPDSLGEVLVLVERGFASYPVARALDLPLQSDELEALEGADGGLESPGALAMAVAIADRQLGIKGAGESSIQNGAAAPVGESAARDGLQLAYAPPSGVEEAISGAGALAIPAQYGRPTFTPPIDGSSDEDKNWLAALFAGRDDRDDDGDKDRKRSGGVRLRLSVPVIDNYQPLPAGLRLLAAAVAPALAGGRTVLGVPGGVAAGLPALVTLDLMGPAAGPVLDVLSAGPGGARASISGVLFDEFRRRQPVALGKAILRGLVREAMASTVEREIHKESRLLGDLVGLAADVGMATLERADTRSWHLVPGEISLMRLRVPAGAHDLSLEIPGTGNGEPETPPLD